MSDLSEQDAGWCRAYARKAVKAAFLTPPLEPQREPDRAMWHLDRNAQLVRAVGSVGDAYQQEFGTDPPAAVLVAVDVATRGYYTNPYPGDNVIHRAMIAPLRARLDAFDYATLRDVVEGRTDRLPLDLHVDRATQDLADTILRERGLQRDREPT